MEVGYKKFEESNLRQLNCSEQNPTELVTIDKKYSKNEQSIQGSCDNRKLEQNSEAIPTCSSRLSHLNTYEDSLVILSSISSDEGHNISKNHKKENEAEAEAGDYSNSPPESPQSNLSLFAWQYQVRTFKMFFAILFIISAFEGIILYKTIAITHVAPLAKVYRAGQVLQTSVDLLQEERSNATVNIETIQAVFAALNNFPVVIEEAKGEGEKIWYLQLIATCIHLAITTTIACLAYYYRDHKSVKSRGRPFLLQAFSSGILFVIFMFLVNTSLCMMFTNFPNFEVLDGNTSSSIKATINKLLNLVFSFLVLSVLSSTIFVGSVVQRQRIIYKCFIKTFSTRKLDYFHLLPWHFIISGVCCVSFVWVRFFNEFDIGTPTSRVGNFGAWLIIIIYSCWFLFYAISSRNAHYRFSDFYSNVRLLITFDVATMVILIYGLCANDSVISLCCGESTIARYSVTIYALDQTCCLIAHTSELAAIPLTMSSISDSE